MRTFVNDIAKKTVRTLLIKVLMPTILYLYNVRFLSKYYYDFYFLSWLNEIFEAYHLDIIFYKVT